MMERSEQWLLNEVLELNGPETHLLASKRPEEEESLLKSSFATASDWPEFSKGFLASLII